MDYPDYVETIGALTLPGQPESVLEETDPQYLRVSLVDVEEVPYLPKGFEIYQTVSTGVEMPVSLHFVVDQDENAWCFNPQIAYCSDFDLLNTWFRKAKFPLTTQEEAGSLARFIIEIGISTVHHPDDFIFLRLAQDFGVQFFQFLRNIEDIYIKNYDAHRSESEREEYKSMTERYRDRIKRETVVPVGKNWQLHGFTYKMMRASGELREWTIEVRPNRKVTVDMKVLEEGIGEVTWSWAL
jgi:hypothetical protein